MLITSVRTKLYRWKGPVKIDDTVFATPLSALAFQSDAQEGQRGQVHINNGPVPFVPPLGGVRGLESKAL